MVAPSGKAGLPAGYRYSIDFKLERVECQYRYRNKGAGGRVLSEHLSTFFHHVRQAVCIMVFYQDSDLYDVFCLTTCFVKHRQQIVECSIDLGFEIIASTFAYADLARDVNRSCA